MSESMYKLVFFVPFKEAQQVKDAIFATGAGSIGEYSCCSWETLGTGQFRPLEGSNPSIGAINKLEKVEELRVEVLCEEHNIKEATQAMLKAHSYEEPAYEIYKVYTLESLK